VPLRTTHSDKAPAAIGPYSQAVIANGLLFTAGQVALDPVSMQVVEGLATHENSAVGVNRHAAQRLSQVTRTQFGGSTSAAREAREAEELSARLVRRHGSGEW
jgi:enamine deaminase RidA (YjgF/YER057c/UK114 family)